MSCLRACSIRLKCSCKESAISCSSKAFTNPPTFNCLLLVFSDDLTFFCSAILKHTHASVTEINDVGDERCDVSCVTINLWCDLSRPVNACIEYLW